MITFAVIVAVLICAVLAGVGLWLKSYGFATIAMAFAVLFAVVKVGLNPILAIILLIVLGLLSWYFYKASDTPKASDRRTANDRSALGAAAVVVAIGVFTIVGAVQSGPDTSTESAAVSAVVNGQTHQYEPVSSSAPLKEQVGNTDRVVYYAYEAEAGTNNFGPALQLNKAEDGLARVAEKLGSDPVFTATVIEFDQKGDKLDTATTMNRATMYAKDGQVRHNDAQAFASNIVRADLIDMGAVKYDSVGMVPDPSGDRNIMPQLTKFSTQPAMEQTLVLTMKNGRQLFLRVECDLQPSVQKFDHVAPPATPEKPPVTPPTTYVPPTPPTQVTTTPPPKTTTTTTSPSTSTTTTTPSTSTTTTTPSTSTTTTTTETTTTTTPPETTTTTPPVTTTTSPGKEPTKDPCVTGNDPHGCQTDGDDPITAAPEPSDPAVPEDEAPATYTTPPAPQPTTVPREDPIPTENEGAPTEAPVTGELDPGACAVCGEAEDSGYAGVQMVPIAPAPVESGGNTDSSVSGDDGASAPVIGEDSAPAEVQQPADPPVADVPVDTASDLPVVTTPVENKAYTSTTSQSNSILLAALILASWFIGAVGRRSFKRR